MGMKTAEELKMCECEQPVCHARIARDHWQALRGAGNVVSVACYALRKYDVIAKYGNAVAVRANEKGECVEVQTCSESK